METQDTRRMLLGEHDDRLHLTLSADLKRAAGQAASRQSMSLSEWVRFWMSIGLDREAAEPAPDFDVSAG